MRRLSILAIPTRGGIVLVDPRDVTHAVSDGHLVTVHTRQGAALLTACSLRGLHARLRARVDRVHRRALLCLRHVARLVPLATGGYVAWTTTGARVEVSRMAARALRRRLGLGASST